MSTRPVFSLAIPRGKRLHQTLSKAVTHGVLIAISAVMLVPLVWMVSTALKPLGQVFVYPPEFIPHPPMWENIGEALKLGRPLYSWERFLLNTVLVVVGCMAGCLISDPLAAFGFSRLRFPGRDAIIVAFLATMMIPGSVTLIPTFLLFKGLGWLDSLRPLIIPAFFGNAFYIFLLRQFFNSIPRELDEAARIDGANELQIYWGIMLPLARPAIATMLIFVFLRAWNDFLLPLVVLTDPKRWTLALAFQGYADPYGTMLKPWNSIMVMATFLVIPCLFVFFVFQKSFIQGIALTGLKG